jgi:LmbE family N-acetylglucosaminyl deacetylase
VPRNLYKGPADERIRRALAIVAHPDDVEFYCGATVLELTDRGVAVALVVATSGDKGTRREGVTSEQLAQQREAEQRAAARTLGIEDVDFLRHPDAELFESLELRLELVRAIRRARPDLLLTFDPGGGPRFHPDHRVVGRSALDAAWPCARDRLFHPELGEPWETAEAWCCGGWAKGVVVEVGERIERKIEARLEHRSQTGDPETLRTRWRRLAAVERFRQVDLR